MNGSSSVQYSIVHAVQYSTCAQTDVSGSYVCLFFSMFTDTFFIIFSSSWWPLMKEEVEEFVAACLVRSVQQSG